MKHLLASCLLVALALFSLTACSSVKLGGVHVNVVDIKPAAPSDKGMQVVLNLSFTNENIISIGITKASHKLYLNGTYVGKSTGENAIGLAQTATQTQAVTFHIENASLLHELASTAKNQTASYRLESKMEVMIGEEKLPIGATSSGSIDLRPLAEPK